MFNKIEPFIERIIFETRWLMVPLFLGLTVALGVFAFHFCVQVVDFAANVFTYEKNDLLLNVLTFVDKVLVGSLIVMVLIGGYENAVGKLNVSEERKKLAWLGKVDSGSLKIKLATAIVSISSVHLLKIFLDVSKYTFEELAWTTGIHFVMVLTAIMLAFMDRIHQK